MSRKLRKLKSVVHNFFGTYCSRYSASNGYWLFGFLVQASFPIDFDLLSADGAATGDIVSRAHALAVRRFSDQRMKLGLPPATIRAARLRIERGSEAMLPAAMADRSNAVVRSCYKLELIASVQTDAGQRYQARTLVFASPHDPAHERQSVERPER